MEAKSLGTQQSNKLNRAARRAGIAQKINEPSPEQPRTRRERRAALGAQATLEKVSWDVAIQARRRVSDTAIVVRVPYRV